MATSIDPNRVRHIVDEELSLTKLGYVLDASANASGRVTLTVMHPLRGKAIAEFTSPPGSESVAIDSLKRLIGRWEDLRVTHSAVDVRTEAVPLLGALRFVAIQALAKHAQSVRRANEAVSALINLAIYMQLELSMLTSEEVDWLLAAIDSDRDAFVGARRRPTTPT